MSLQSLCLLYVTRGQSVQILRNYIYAVALHSALPGPRAGPQKVTLSTKFFQSYLKSPGLVGAILPSSCWLANALCRHTRGARYIIELGAGTGAVTQHLRATFPNVPMIVVERDAPLAAALELRFGRCKVVAMCLHDAPELLSGLPPDTTIVSSLPFLSLPKEVVAPTVSLLKEFLLHDRRRRLVQYTYGPQRPFDPDSGVLTWRREELVLRNLPPAWVWSLQARDPEQAKARPEAVPA